MNRESRKKLFREVDIYPVTCERLSAGRSNVGVLEEVIQGGARIIQLREKQYTKRRLYYQALKFREITSRAGVLLIINDHLDIALAVGADGVHLGQDDLPIEVARNLAPELLIGASSHSLEQALQAQKDGADYVNLGPIFHTATKEKAGEALGPEVIEEISPYLEVPFTVMGGIKESNLEELLAKGAQRFAMVTAITQARDVAGTVADLRKKIREYDFGLLRGRNADI